MPFPGAPLDITETELRKLEDRCNEQLTEALIEHAAIEDMCEENDRAYTAEPSSRRKTFPWPGAANIVLPLVGTTIDSIVARIVNTIFGVNPLFTVRPRVPQMEAFAKSATDFMDWSVENEFNAYQEIKTAAIETVQDGWSWLKPGYSVEECEYFEPSANGKATPRKETKRRATLSHVLITDVIGQPGVGEELDGDYLFHRFRLTDSTLINRGLDEVYLDVDEIIDKKDDVMLAGLRTDASNQPRVNTLYEVYAKVAYRKNQRPVNCLLTFHKPTKKIIRAIYNPMLDGSWNLVKLKFVERKGFKEGLGIARMLRQLQEELTSIHCQQLDNATIANTRFFVGKRGISGLSSKTRIWPGRWIFTGDPHKDINVVPMGDIYNSMHMLEMSVLAFAERRSGISDPQLGRESEILGGRATATGTLAMIQEGNRRFDLNVRDMRHGLGTAGDLLLMINQQFRQKGFAYFVQGEDGKLTEAVLDMPRELVRNKLGVELTASTATINRQMEQTGLIALNQVLTQNLGLGQQIGMIVASQQVPAEIKEYLVRYAKVITDNVKKIAKTFEQPMTDAMIPYLMEEIANGGGGSNGQASAGGGMGRAAVDQRMGRPSRLPAGPTQNGV